MTTILKGWEIPDWASNSKLSMKKIYRISLENYIIFKNTNNEFDWMSSKEFNQNNTDKIYSYIDEIYSKIVLLLSYIPKDIDEETLDVIYTICSEAMSAIFNQNLTLATDIITSLEERISVYKYEKYTKIVHETVGCNFYILSGSLLLAYVMNVLCNWQTISFVITSFCIGGMGSISSILSTKKHINFKEILKDNSVIQDVNYKILLGGIFACISYAAITSNFLEIFEKFNFYQSIVVFFLCGFSERMAPSIFEKFK